MPQNFEKAKIIFSPKIIVSAVRVLCRIYTVPGPQTRKMERGKIPNAAAFTPGGATPRFWTPTTPPTNCWPEAPGGGGGGGHWRGELGGGGLGGAWGGGVREGRLGGGLWEGRWGGGGTGSPYLPLPSL